MNLRQKNASFSEDKVEGGGIRKYSKMIILHREIRKEKINFNGALHNDFYLAIKCETINYLCATHVFPAFQSIKI